VNPQIRLATYQAHCAVAQPGDLWSILAELCSRQLGLASDLANGLLNLVHDVVCSVVRDVVRRG
jgi:hypothetical protein